MRKILSRRRVFEQDSVSVANSYPSWSPIGQKYNIHWYLCRQSKAIQGIGSHRCDLRFVTSGYRLSDVFDGGVDDSKPVVFIFFGVIIDAVLSYLQCFDLTFVPYF